MRIAIALVAASIGAAGLGSAARQADVPIAFTGARVLAGPSGTPIDDALLVVRNGRVETIGVASAMRRPGNARVVDLGRKVVIPGLVAAHVHVSDVQGTGPRAYTDANTLRQLGVYARYGITTLLSLGGEQAPAFKARDAQGTAALDRSRLFVSGDVVTGRTPEEARATVARVAALEPDFIKIRVDDNLGTATKMAPEVYRAAIEEAHGRGLRVAAHIFYLDDAKALLKAGVDMIAHSVRDKPIDLEFIQLMKDRGVPYCPTLTREVSTFVYESTPAFFADPFFLREADRGVMAQVQEPARQQAMRASPTARGYKAALDVAKRNLKAAADAGLFIVMGTDSGAFPERFQGYFEHLEMEMMVESGMTPAQVVRSATADAARALRVEDVGRLVPTAWADFVVLDKDPLADIRHTRSIASVWIAGNQVK